MKIFKEFLKLLSHLKILNTDFDLCRKWLYIKLPKIMTSITYWINILNL